MNEQQIRKIVDDEINKKLFRFPKVPPHKHDGADNIQIQEQYITGNKINSGTITFSKQTQYTIAVNFKPKSVWFYGIAVNSLSAPTIRAQCIGNALLNGAYYSAPSTTTSVTVGLTQQNIAQSSTYIVIDNSGASPAFHALADQTHIVSVAYGGTIYARMTVVSATRGIILNVDDLVSGWSIVGNFVIT